MTTEKHGDSRSGPCLTRQCERCTYEPCPCVRCVHPNRVVAQANRGQIGYDGGGNDERPPAVTEDRPSHSDSSSRKEGVGSW